MCPRKSGTATGVIVASIGHSSQPVCFLSLVSHHTSPKARGSPDARTQAFQLDDLTVIHEEVHFGTPVLDVPSEYLRIGRLEHHLLQAERVDDAGWYICAPLFHVLCDAFGFDHDHVGPSVKKSLCQPDGPLGVAGPFCLEFFSSRGTPSSKLNAYLRLGLQPGLLHLLYQSQPVIGGHGNKATGNLDDVKPYFLALPDITLHRILALPEHMFEKASGRDKDIMLMTQLCDFQKSATRHQREGTSSKLQGIHIASHRIDD